MNSLKSERGYAPRMFLHGVAVYHRCSHRFLQLSGEKQHEFVLLLCGRSEVTELKSRCWQSWFLHEALERTRFSAFFSSGDCLQTLAWGRPPSKHTASVSASIITPIPPPSLQRDPCDDIKATQIISHARTLNSVSSTEFPLPYKLTFTGSGDWDMNISGRRWHHSAYHA